MWGLFHLYWLLFGMSWITLKEFFKNSCIWFHNLWVMSHFIISYEVSDICTFPLLWFGVQRKGRLLVRQTFYMLYKLSSLFTEINTILADWCSIWLRYHLAKQLGSLGCCRLYILKLLLEVQLWFLALFSSFQLLCQFVYCYRQFSNSLHVVHTV